MEKRGRILVLNSGSSSIKFAIFDGALVEIARGALTEIGGAGTLSFGTRSRAIHATTHAEALAALMDELEAQGFSPQSLLCAAHRVVHGGEALHEPTRIDERVIEAIEATAPLAPLHNPHNLAGIMALRKLAPKLPQIACFDTGFHQSIAPERRTYALPPMPATSPIKRYGFHGISFAGLVRDWPEVAQIPLPDKLLALHLGNGASLCAIAQGRSLATTMGYSPLEGLIMGTRAGNIDANAVLDLAEHLGLYETRKILNYESGMKALTSLTDMRQIEAQDDDSAQFALDAYTARAIDLSGQMIAAMGGCNAIAFTGGIGENSARIRAEIIGGLAFMGFDIHADQNTINAARIDAQGSKPIAIIPAREEFTIAASALTIMERGA